MKPGPGVLADASNEVRVDSKAELPAAAESYSFRPEPSEQLYVHRWQESDEPVRASSTFARKKVQVAAEKERCTSLLLLHSKALGSLSSLSSLACQRFLSNLLPAPRLGDSSMSRLVHLLEAGQMLAKASKPQRQLSRD